MGLALQEKEKVPKADLFTLTSGQEQALRLIDAARLSSEINQFTLSGYPGTGKTTIISQYVNALRARGISVAVTAPTNKATRILMKKIGRNSGIDFSSVQSLLGLRMDEKEDGTQDCIRKSDPKLKDYRVIVVDECSMVSTALFNDLCRNQGDSFLVFVGDPYQLPPVESAADASHQKISPTFMKRDHWDSFTLSEVVRQVAGNPIIGLASAIRQAETNGERFGPRHVRDFISTISDHRLFLIKQDDIPILGQNLINKAREAGRTDLPVRIVSWTNARVQYYNLQMHTALGAHLAPEGAYFAQGECALAHQEFEGLVMSEVPIYDPKLDCVVRKRTPVERKRIIISEEGTILSIQKGNHPDHPDIHSWEISFLPEDEAEPVFAYIPINQDAFRAYVQQSWDTYRQLRTEKLALEKRLQKLKLDKTSSFEAVRQTENNLKFAAVQTADASRHAWSVQKSHGKIRHAYASTAHKSQGSTWDTTIVDLADLSRMPDDRDYNRALYVAVTRSSGSLAIAL